MAEQKRYKKYVEVTVAFDESGRMLPRTIKWDDELTYEIDKVTDIKQAAWVAGSSITSSRFR